MSNSLIKPNDIHKRCINIVSKYVDCHDGLKFELINKAKGVFALQNKGIPIAMEGNPLFYLVKVKNTKGLYAHLSVTMKAPKIGASFDTNYEFQGISLQFLQGTGLPFCRAEWDLKKKKDKLEHPQPHWHWGNSVVSIDTDTEETEDDGNTGIKDFKELVNRQYSGFEGEPKVENTLPDVDFNEIHYAMMAKWATKDNAVEEFSFQKMYEWLKRCLINVIDQYNYQINKSSFISSRDW